MLKTLFGSFVFDSYEELRKTHKYDIATHDLVFEGAHVGGMQNTRFGQN